MLSVKEFMSILDAFIEAKNDVYAKGCYGQKLTKSLLTSKRKQSKSMTEWYDSACPHYNGTWYEYLLTKLGHQGFDCVCALKGILWGSRPGKCGTYKSNEVPDLNANSFFAKCTGVVADLSKVKAGMVIWFDGHVGLVKDAENVYETSPKTGKIVLRSIKKQPWKKAGYLPWIDYTSCTGATTTTTSSASVEGGDLVTISKGAVYGGADKGVPVPPKYTDGDVFKVKDVKNGEALIAELVSWVPIKYLKVAKGTKLTVTKCTALNVRKGPGMEHAVVRTLKVGQTVIGYEKSGGWWRIGTDQWASGTYLK